VAVYQAVHGMSTKEKRFTHKAFLAKLKTIIDDDAKPIIVTDAGYKTTWFRAVIALGWNFTRRVRKPMTSGLEVCLPYQIGDLHPDLLPIYLSALGVLFIPVNSTQIIDFYTHVSQRSFFNQSYWFLLICLVVEYS
jgi:hypothetical protein